MVKLSTAFGRLRRCRALVLGDFLLDAYTAGRVRRISPEAPVPVLEVLKEEARPGGAGNVALNLAALGSHVIALGRCGNDAHGESLKQYLGEAAQVELVCEAGYQTPVKNRLIADSQQLLRIDFERIAPLAPATEAAILEKLKRYIQEVDIVALSDYAKGALTPAVLSAAIAEGRAAGVPVIIDPKGRNFAQYRGATLLKPNLSEAYAAAHLPPSSPLEEVAARLLTETAVEHLVITRSEAGISLFNRTGGRTDFPVRSKEVKDVTGAGDTVLAVLCVALAGGLSLADAVELANIGAGIAIERVGCVQVTLPEIARRLLATESENKIFAKGQLQALTQVFQERGYALLSIPPNTPLSGALFKTIRSLKRPSLDLILSLDKGSDLAPLLASLQEVDYILMGDDAERLFVETVPPQVNAVFAS
jgi:D-beta-D-heptose 7-phosphate kinase/D-beta-D-heptose 1-phosphate adenosyltransferase